MISKTAPLLTNYKKQILLASPFCITIIGFATALLFGNLIGKWAFIPIILIGWSIMILIILRYAGIKSIKKWLHKPQKNYIWPILSVFLGLTSIPVFVMFHHLLSDWKVLLPWLLLALINPWIEEFYWRGILLDVTEKWKGWYSVSFSSLTFALNHAIFGINSELFRGPEVMLSTLIMGIVWAITYKKTKSLWWCIIAHFLVDFFTLSAPAFLELFNRGWH